MNQPTARLVVRTGNYAGQSFVLGNRPLTIGREPVNDLVFQDPGVSRRHVSIIPQGGGYLVEDLNSTNGTRLNGERISGKRGLQNGDVIALSDAVQLVYEVEGYAQTLVQGAGLPPTRSAFEAMDYPAPPPTMPSVDVSPARTLPVASPMESAPRMVPPPLPDYSMPDVSGMGEKPRSRKRLWIGCGCLLVVLVLACAGGAFWLDANNPDLLYGPVQSILRGFGF